MSSIHRPAKLAAAARYHRARGKTELAAAGRCRRCGRTLTDPDSITAGIGPDCRRQATT